MKLKITITGPKVHDVGYRPWLVELAMSMGLKGFDVYNDEEDGQQIVIALIEADDRRTQKFLSTVNAKRSPLAKVGSIISGDYADNVMPLWQTAAMNAYGQMNKAIPILQAIKDNTDMIPQIAKNTDLIPQIAKNTDLIPQMANNTEKILEEVKGLREDQPGYAVQFRQLQADVKAIKERLGMI
ncbi:MAG: acylphosphatase [Methanotrichaceae archaeon]